MNVVYLDCCLPDYFNGFSGDVLAVPVTNKTTLLELKQALSVVYWSSLYDFNITMSDFGGLTSADIEKWYQDELEAGNTPETVVFPHLNTPKYGCFGVQKRRLEGA